MKTLLHFASQVKKVVFLFFNLRAVMALGLSFVPTQPRGNRVRVGGRWELEDGAGSGPGQPLPHMLLLEPKRRLQSDVRQMHIHPFTGEEFLLRAEGLVFLASLYRETSLGPWWL